MNMNFNEKRVLYLSIPEDDRVEMKVDERKRKCFHNNVNHQSVFPVYKLLLLFLFLRKFLNILVNAAFSMKKVKHLERPLTMKGCQRH
jgi:hypothetical protein